MLYRPKFCCECGEKVERPNWKLWTNRRFCEVCEAELKLSDILPKAGLATCLLLGLFGLGSYLQGHQKPPEIVKQSFTVERKIAPPVSKPEPTPENAGSLSSNSALPESESKAPIPPAKLSVAEPVYYCGAATKKGTPCSRRVKGNVRCWQHAGMPSMHKHNGTEGGQ